MLSKMPFLRTLVVVMLYFQPPSQDKVQLLRRQPTSIQGSVMSEDERMQRLTELFAGCKAAVNLTRHCELARRCLRSVYRVRDSIPIIRSAVMTSDEVIQSVKDSGTSSPSGSVAFEDFKVAQAVYNTRWKSAREAMSDLQRELLEAQVSWGKEAVEAMKPLFESEHP